MITIYPRWDPSAIATEEPEVTLPEIRAFHKWEDIQGDLTVAVVDSGIDSNHPVFEGIEIEHRDMTGRSHPKRDQVGHGSASASIIAQLAPVKKIIDVRVFGSEGKTSGETLMRAYDFLLANADRIDLANFSLGTSQKVDAIDARQNQLVAKGIRTVSASGNSGEDSGSPACADRAFSAGALTLAGEMTNFSAYSPEHGTPSLCALGKNIKLARAEGTSMGHVLDDKWVMASGTSFACPILLSAVACQMATNGAFVRGDFRNSAEQIAESKRDGHGKLNLNKALELSGANPSDPQEPVTTEMYAHKYGGGDGDKNLIWLQRQLFAPGNYSVTLDGNKLTVEEQD